jgi:trehalose synthase
VKSGKSVVVHRVREVRIEPRQTESFAGVLGEDIVRETETLAARVRSTLDGRTIWNVNSTAAGGGVAEMLHTLLSYARGLGIDTRWLVIHGNPDFFRITKRIHNALHGEPGDGSVLDGESRNVYEQVCQANATELERFVRPADPVILHDPQTAGLIPHLARRGVPVIWRCHIGQDEPSDEARAAWSFLEPYLTQARAFVFSRFSYLPDSLYHGRCLVVPPSIDPFSPKNQEMDESIVASILSHVGLVDCESAGGPRAFIRGDGTSGRVERRAEVVREGPGPSRDTPLVVQVSRWDRLKDPIGVLEGFVCAIHNSGVDGAQLVLAGPDVEGVTDDPEGAEVFGETLATWKQLPDADRRRVHIATLPMDDLQENAAIVNALQRHAAIVVQKSLREGFGLTVTEAMWKARPVIASAVGGICDQIEHGVSGLLLRDPRDHDAFAGAVTQILGNDGLARRLGRNARRRVSKNYLGLRIVAQYDDLLERVDHDCPEPRASRWKATGSQGPVGQSAGAG